MIYLPSQHLYDVKTAEAVLLAFGNKIPLRGSRYAPHFRRRYALNGTSEGDAVSRLYLYKYKRI